MSSLNSCSSVMLTICLMCLCYSLGLLVKSVKAKALGYMEKKKKKKQSLLF